MPDLGFPTDEYTPHGYLANPFAVAHSWSDGEGGCIRTTRDQIGVGWQLPWSLRARASADLVVMLRAPGKMMMGRARFDAAGLGSPHHTSRLLVLRWSAFGRVWEAAYTLVERDLLGLEVSWQPTEARLRSDGDEDADEPLPEVTVIVSLAGRRREEPGAPASEWISAGSALDLLRHAPDDPVGWVDLGEPYGRYELLVDGGAAVRLGPAIGAPLRGDMTEDESAKDGPSEAANAGANVAMSFLIDSQAAGTILALARRTAGTSSEDMPVRSLVSKALARARQEDAAFWSGAARLDGDWPAHWRRGWVYDIETTRMCIYPAGGIFTDVWPAWMVQWPRAVVAEGALDAVRLAYASPDLAQRAALSLFRDAPAANVPCVFQHGEPNMVANDGSVCGTSPAWCVPFYNLERLFALTLDRDWLSEIYPFLARYVDWWLAERTDAEGWAVYKCTWEAGEDDTPRLDPERRGDNVVSAFVRPVELQATMALSAGVLGRFADLLGRTDDSERWRQVEADFAARTRTLWDAEAGRFRDWDARTGRFLEPAGEANYWGIDPCRYSALAFAPVLAGIADPGQLQALSRELRHYAGPPWTLWASWSYVVLEAATLAGEREFAGNVAADIIGRVYEELDAREIAAPSHPTPGVAREYWPLDLDTWASCEGYGWGANTASLLIRQIFGFLEGPYVDSPLRFTVAPSLPAGLLIPGREYRLSNLPYRGTRLDLGYRVGGRQGGPAEGVANLTLLIATDAPTACEVTAEDGTTVYRSATPVDRHEIAGLNGRAYDVVLTP
jgi:hypothetical protein